MMNSDIIKSIENGECSLGIELGSTRIKGILITPDTKPVASGAFDWENRNDNGVWIYTIDDILTGIHDCYQDLKKDVLEKYGIKLTKLKNMGVSAMMHGYMAFDKDGNLLTPFRTWRNTMTAEESEELSALFNYPIPQRWTVSHLLKDIKEKKEYLGNLDHVMTLAAYVHYLLTGEKKIGIGDASGMFPIDFSTSDYSENAIKQFEEKYLKGHYSWGIRDIFPEVLIAGVNAGHLTESGARLLDDELEAGAAFCPPEGDAETGMAATDSVRVRTGNVSAGTSAFVMAILEKPLSKVYPVLDIVATPDGKPAAMAHSNNCTGSYDGWMRIFREVIERLGLDVPKGKLYDTVLLSSLEADKDAGGMLSYGYISGEHITGFEAGRPLTARSPESHFTLPNLILSELYSALSAMRIGLDILFDKEGVQLDFITGHGGFFKTKESGAHAMAAALRTPCRVMETAGEGGAWGIAILASYLDHTNLALPDYLDEYAFSDSSSYMYTAIEEERKGYDKYLERYKKGFAIERAAIDNLEDYNA